jgi:hypothetical protein
MPRNNFTDITIILDRSGSMSAIRDGTINGINGFIEEQRGVPGDGFWTLVQFDHEYEVVYSQISQEQVRLLKRETFQPRGNTALIDAVCRTIHETIARLAGLPDEEYPSGVMFVIMTDGLENASRTFRREDLKKLIERQENEFNWQFVFLGANQDAIAEGAKYGIHQNAMNYDYTDAGTARALGAVCMGTRAWKLDGNQSAAKLFVPPVPDVNINVNASLPGEKEITAADGSKEK